MTSTRTRALGTVVVSLALLGGGLSAATPALAGGADSIRQGNCSARADWKLKAGLDDGRVDLELEIDSNVAGQTWSWTLADNGRRFASGTSRTVRPSGSFTVDRRTANRPGRDRISFVARNVRSGETCRGSVLV